MSHSGQLECKDAKSLFKRVVILEVRLSMGHGVDPADILVCLGSSEHVIENMSPWAEAVN